jgi:hypothetical protein
MINGGNKFSFNLKVIHDGCGLKTRTGAEAPEKKGLQQLRQAIDI